MEALTFFFSAGEGAIDPNDPNKENTLNQLVKTEISLSLTRKYDLREGEEQDIKGLMIKYDFKICDIEKAFVNES